jgi:hypothetical protein
MAPGRKRQTECQKECAAVAVLSGDRDWWYLRRSGVLSLSVWLGA